VKGEAKVSASTVARLSIYLRLLTELEAEGIDALASDELARRCGTSAAQVRKDLSLFGTFGTRGLGYPVPELATALRRILGLERRWRVALIGAGRIGAALLGYEGFSRQGFDIAAVFDNDADKIGTDWNGLTVRSDAELETVLGAGIEIVIIAVPAAAAQGVVDRVVRSGVRAVLNFAPTKLRVPAHVELKTVNMALELEALSYALVNNTLERTVKARPAAAGGRPSARGRGRPANGADGHG
jgi:redox-sensing transcriptional repressor